MKRQQGNLMAWQVGCIVFAVVAAIGWYFYYQQLQQNDSISLDLNAEKDALRLKLQGLRLELADSSTRNQQLSAQNVSLKSDLSSSHQEKIELQKEMQRELERITLANTGLRQELERTASASVELQQELAHKTAASSELQRQLQQQLSVQASLNQKIAAATGTSTELETTLEQERDRRRRLQLQIDQVSNDIGLKELALLAATEQFSELGRQLEQTRQEHGRLKATVAELNRQRVDDAEHFAKLKNLLESELNESRVVISQLKNRMTVIKLTNEVLFNSGSAEIKLAGKKVLSLIADSLNAYPERAISIEGHTDNIPIGTNSEYASNWQLSTARALAALRFFQQDNQVDPKRLQLVGYGEHHPVSNNETAAGRALNRRIEIKVLPQE